MKNNSTLLIIIISLSVLIFSVSCIKRNTEWKGTIEEIDGVTIVKNPKEPILKSGARIHIAFKEELSFGAKEGDENYMFGSQVFFNTDEEGNFYVTDWDRKEIKKFNPNGNYLMSIGRQGQGPGEFQNISVPKFDNNGNMYVMDIVSRRISFFSYEGNLISELKIPINLDERIYINSKGEILGKQLTFDDQQYVAKTMTLLGLYDNEFNLKAEIFKEISELKPSAGRDADSRAKYHAELLGNRAFQPTITYLLAKNDYIYFGYPKKYEIQVYNIDGKLKKIIQKESAPIAVNKRDIQNYLDYQKEHIYKYVPLPDEIRKKAFQLAKFPEYKPPYQRFTIMENGWLFVIVDSIKDEYSLIDIFDQEGKYISHFITQIPTDWIFFNNGKAYAVAEEDEFKIIKRFSYEIEE